jgi:hypothetical protein
MLHAVDGDEGIPKSVGDFLHGRYDGPFLNWEMLRDGGREDLRGTLRRRWGTQKRVEFHGSGIPWPFLFFGIVVNEGLIRQRLERKNGRTGAKLTAI